MSKLLPFTNLRKEGRQKTAEFLEVLKRKLSFQIQKNSSDTVWWNESLSPKEKLLAYAGSYLAVSLVLWLFYRSLLGFIVALPFTFFAFSLVKSKIIDHKNMLLRSRFLDVLGSLESSLEAGESPEGAMQSCLQNLTLMYKTDDIIVVEMTEILRKLYSNQSLEEAFTDFAGKTKDEDIKSFANVFAISKRSGGDLLEILRSTLHTMAEKEDVKRQISLLIAAKRMEAGAMALMPPGIILYFQLVDKSFLMPLYQGLGGRAIMTLLLAAYAACLYLMLRITNIKV